jgi:hypothetical protein
MVKVDMVPATVSHTRLSYAVLQNYLLAPPFAFTDPVMSADTEICRLLWFLFVLVPSLVKPDSLLPQLTARFS